MEFIDVCKKRESTRKFKDQQVNQDDLTKVLEMSNLAPTAKNKQPQKIYVVQSKEGLNKIDKATMCRYNAPTVLIVCSDKNIAYNENNHSTYEIDASIVATHIILGATNYGIDNIWIEMFDKNIIKEEFDLDDNIEPICLIPLGYRIDNYVSSILHSQRKNLDDIIKYI